MISRSALAAAALLAVSLAACGGGGSAVPAQTPAAAQLKAPASASILIPGRATTGSSSSRSPRWVSPSTMSLIFRAVRSDGYGYVATVQLTPNSPNCTALAGGARRCDVQFAAPVTSGTLTDEIMIQLFDNVDPYFSWPLAQADVFNQTVSASGANNFAFVLGGVVGRQIAVPVPSPATVTHGTPATVTIPLAVADPDNNPISGLLDSPLKITLSSTASFTFATPAAQPDGSVTVADTSLTPSITLNYNGGTAATTITIATTSTNSAQIASGATTGFVTPLTITPK